MPWLVGALVVSIPLLLIDVSNEPLGIFIAQLVALVLLALVLAHRLAPLSTATWFVGASWRTIVNVTASGVGLIVLVTGTVGLVTIASSAALRFDPSLQFLQLLSALDIAWVVAAISVGAYRTWTPGVAVGLSATVGIICVWSIWRYLHAVGFGSNGEWIVSGPDLARYVLPFDVVAALMAVALFVLGSLKAVQAIEQPRAQS